MDHVGRLERGPGRLGVDVVPNVEGGEVAVDERDVIVAVGARTVLPPGARALDVPAMTDLDVLRGSWARAVRIVVYDAEGGQRGAMIVARLSEEDAAVTCSGAATRPASFSNR